MSRAAIVAAAALAVACAPKHRDSGKQGVDWARSGIDWTKRPAPGPEPAWSPPRPVEVTLPGGPRVLLVENDRLPLVSVRVIFDRAGAREDGAQAGLAALTADLLGEGAGDLDALAFPEAVERLGATLDTGVAEDASVIYLDSLASTLPDSLRLLADVVMRPRLDPADFARMQEDAVEELKLRPQEPRRVANLVFDRAVYGDHPYGQPVAGHVRTVAALTLEDVRRFWRTRYVPAHATIVVAGDVTAGELERLLGDAFAGWRGPALPAASAPATPPAPTPRLLYVDRPGAPQSVVMIGTRGADVRDPDFHAVETVNTALGGSFTSRLNTRLREELGYTYGIAAFAWRGRWAGTSAISTSLRTDVTRAGLDEILAIVERTRREPLGAAELARAQQVLVHGLPQAFESNAQTTGELTTLVLGDRPLDWHQGFAAGVRAVTVEAAQAAAAARWGDLVIVVVGDWSAIGEGLTGLGLPVEALDAEGAPARP